MTDENVTQFVEIEDGEVTLDREALHQRLEEEGLEEALERDDVRVTSAEQHVEAIADAIEASKVSMEELEENNNE
jgi:hypothetical protein